MLSGKRILVVDDQKELTACIAGALELEGYQVSQANSVEEAADALDEHMYDLILTDINMPEQSGYDLLRLMKSESMPMPIVVMSGMHLEAWLAKSAGFADQIAKPFQMNEVIDVVFRNLAVGWRN